MAQYRRHSPDFKLQAVQRLLADDRPLTQVAKELGISPSLLHQWKEAYLASPEPVLGADRKESSEQTISRLTREVEKLRQERDFLKKAVGFFSQNPE